VSVEHAAWCSAVWAPHYSKRGPKQGQAKTGRRAARCTCGASDSPFKRLVRRVREMVG
jgi:hypothetical protein